MKKLTSALIISLLSLCLVSTAFAAPANQKIKSFDFLVDQSMSMGWKYQKSGAQRITLAQELLGKINSRIPSRSYQAGLHTFAPSAAYYGFTSYDRNAMQGAIDELSDRFVRDGSRMSAGSGLDALGRDYSNLSRPGAVILVTDGDYGAGRDSVNEAKIFYQTQPDMCLHVISFANTDEQQAILDNIAALNPCSVSVSAADLLTSDAAVDSFVNKVWGTDYEKVIMSSNEVHFTFDSAVLHDSQLKVVDGILADLQEDSGLNVRIEGYTCNVGPADYNKSLSLRRADAVKGYLVSKGIAPARVVTAGHGEIDPIADNANLDGRKKNRRVEFTFFK